MTATLYSTEELTSLFVHVKFWKNLPDQGNFYQVQSGSLIYFIFTVNRLQVFLCWHNKQECKLGKIIDGFTVRRQIKRWVIEWLMAATNTVLAFSTGNADRSPRAAAYIYRFSESQLISLILTCQVTFRSAIFRTVFWQKHILFHTRVPRN